MLVPGERSDKDLVRWAGEKEYRHLLDEGVAIKVFQPSMLHEKAMTADGRVAVVGSSNINSRSMSEDDEVVMVIFDPDIVERLDRDLDDDMDRAEDLDPADWARRGLLRRILESAASTISDLL